MSAEPSSVHVRTRFDGRVFVPDEPLDLPVGATLEGEARRPSIANGARGDWKADIGARETFLPRKPVGSQEEWITFLNSVEGCWVGPEMEEPEDPHPEEPDF